MDKRDPNEPTEPMLRTDPTERIERIDPFEPMQRKESEERIDHREVSSVRAASCIRPIVADRSVLRHRELGGFWSRHVRTAARAASSREDQGCNQTRARRTTTNSAAVRSGRLKKNRNLQAHLVVYVLVNAFLVVIWAVARAHIFCPVFPIVRWGILVAMNAWALYRPDEPTEQRIREETERLRNEE